MRTESCAWLRGPFSLIKFDVIATIPGIFDGFTGASILGRAAEQNLIEIRIHDLRQWAKDKHRMIDDRPFGGGAGMVLKPEPLFDAIESLLAPESRLIVLAPSGRRFDQGHARDLSGAEHLILVCGRYEGIDERVIDHFKPELLSIGDYVIAGGEVAAMVVIEAVARLVPGVLGNEESTVDESFVDARLEYPQYTRPADFRGRKVPEILISGDHKKIAEWRKQESAARTKLRRPDLKG